MVILPGDPKRCQKIAQFFDDPVLVVAGQQGVCDLHGNANGEKVSVTSTGIGGPSASIAMEELVQCGADTFVLGRNLRRNRFECKGRRYCHRYRRAIRMEGTSKRVRAYRISGSGGSGGGQRMLLVTAIPRHVDASFNRASK